MRVTARCIRQDGWWAVDVPDVDGAYTQARRLDQVPAMVADAVALLTDVEASSVDVDVVPQFDDHVSARVAAAHRLRKEAVTIQHRAAHEARAAARSLRAQGLPLRDVGTVLGISYQRAHQLTRAKDARSVGEARERFRRPVGPPGDAGELTVDERRDRPGPVA